MPTDVNMKSFFSLFVEKDKSYHFVHGGAIGADTIAAREAIARKWDVMCMKPDWSIGRSAGHIRNAEMVKQDPKIVIGFIKGESKGTKGCLKLVAKSKSVEVIYLWDEGVTMALTPKTLGEYLKQ